MRSALALVIAGLALAQDTTVVPGSSTGSQSYTNPFTSYTTQTDSLGVITGMPSVVTSQPSVVTIPAGLSSGVIPSVSVPSMNVTNAMGSSSTAASGTDDATVAPETITSTSSSSSSEETTSGTMGSTPTPSTGAANLAQPLLGMGVAGAFFAVFL